MMPFFLIFSYDDLVVILAIPNNYVMKCGVWMSELLLLLRKQMKKRIYIKEKFNFKFDMFFFFSFFKWMRVKGILQFGLAESKSKKQCKIKRDGRINWSDIRRRWHKAAMGVQSQKLVLYTNKCNLLHLAINRSGFASHNQPTDCCTHKPRDKVLFKTSCNVPSSARL